MQEHKYFFDTNIFLRTVVNDDKQKAQECEQVLLALSSGTIRGVTSHVVLSEFVWTCLSFYKIRKPEVVSLLNGIVGFKHLVIQDNFDILSAMAFYTSHNVKYIDALIASHLFFSKKGAKILSYDRDFDKLKIHRIEPHMIK